MWIKNLAMDFRNKSSMDYTSLGCCAFAFFLYLNTLNAGFVYDDRRAILSNSDVSGSNPWQQAFLNDYWGTPLADSGSHGSYRPLCVLSFKFNYILGGYTPWGYHLINNLMHCLATGLVVKLARHLLSSVWGIVATGALFAAHPIHTEAVAGIVGRADLAACICYLLTFLAYVKHIAWRERNDSRQWPVLGAAVVMAVAALLFKETAITALLVCGLFDVMRGMCGFVDKNRYRTMGIISAALATIIYIRLSAIPSPQRSFSTADNPVAKAESVWTRFLTFLYLPVFNFQLLLYPSVLSFDWGMNAVRMITGLEDKRNFLTIAFYSAMLLTLWRCAQFLLRAQEGPKASSPLPTRHLHSHSHRKSRTKNKYAALVPTPTPLLVLHNESFCKTCKHEVATSNACSSCRALLNNNNNNNNNEGSYDLCKDCQKQLHDAYDTHQIVPSHHDVTPRSSRSSSSCSNSTTASSASSSSSEACASPKRPDAPVPCNAIVLVMAIAFLTLPFLPATNLFFYVGFVIAERLLYLPSVGYCLLVGFGIGKLIEPLRATHRKRVAVILCMSLVLSMLSIRTWRRNADWRDEESLFRSAAAVNPAKALGNLGSVLSSQGRYAEAKVALQEALKHKPNMADVHFNLGIVHQNQGNHKSAVDNFQRAIQCRPNLAVAYLNLGASLIALGRCQEAATVLQVGSNADGVGVRDRASHENARMSSFLQLGSLYAEQGKLHRALAVYREALHSLPANYQSEVLYHRIGDVFGRLQQWDEAEKYQRAALEIQPDHVASHLSVGMTLAKNSSRASEAEMWFKRALKLAPEQSSVFHHYAEFLTGLNRHDEAIYYRLRAAELSPNDYSLAVAAATALRLLDRKVEAERWYRRAATLRPDDARAHTNLGAILHLLGRTQKAAASYKEALRLQPGDPTTLGNLAKLGITEAK